MKRLLASGLAGCVMACLVQSAQAGDPLQLQKSVRTLEGLQDAAANGDPTAVGLQGQLITQIEADIRHAQDTDLQRPQNLRSLAVVLLSGANPTVVEAHTTALPMDDNNRNLLQGALAYARADREAALKFLGEVKTADLPPSLAGRVALVRSIIGAAENPARAIDDLYTARQLMPGTSIEEAALRRCVAFAGKTGDIDRLRFCSGRYMRRFAHSLYWREFEASLAIAVAQTGYGQDDSFKQLIEASGRLDTTRQRGLLLSLAKAALTHGRLELSMQLSEAAVAVSLAESPEMSRAKLYRAAALIVSGSYAQGSALLDRLKPEVLDEADHALYAMARQVAGQIVAMPGISAPEASRMLSTQVDATADPVIDKVILAATETLTRSQKLSVPTQP